MGIKCFILGCFLWGVFPVYSQEGSEVKNDTFTRQMSEACKWCARQLDSLEALNREIDALRTGITQLKERFVNSCKDYCTQPFVNMQNEKISGFRRQAESFGFKEMEKLCLQAERNLDIYKEATELLDRKYKKEDIENALNELESMKDLSETQSEETQKIKTLLNRFGKAIEEARNIIKLKNQKLKGFKYKADWKEKNAWNTTIDPENEIRSKIASALEQYSEIHYLKDWLTNYERIIFVNVANPFTLETDIQKEVNKELQEMENELKN